MATLAEALDGDGHPSERGFVEIEAIGSRSAYRDMADFAESVGELHTRGLLNRALAGRGAFRRFRNIVFDTPELIDAWKRIRRRRQSDVRSTAPDRT